MSAKFIQVAVWTWTAFLAVASTGFHQAVADVPRGFFVDLKSLGPEVNSTEIDIEPYISLDGSTLYFGSNRSGDYEIYQASRAYDGAPFANVMNLGLSEFPHAGPFVFGDELYFYENRAGHTDLVVATRETPDGPFGSVTNLEDLNTPNGDAGPHVSADGHRLYFVSSRPGGQGGFDIYVASRTDNNEPFSNPTNLGLGINSPYNEFDPSLSFDELTIFFTDIAGPSDTPRPEGLGSGDIWVATRDTIEEEFGEPINLNDFSLGPPVNTDTYDIMPYISPAWPAVGSKLYFASRQPGNDPPGASGLFEATWIPELSNDFSGDGTVGVVDVDLLVGQIVSRSDNRWFDLNNDTVVDNDDLERWLKDAAAQNGFSEPYLPGDANLDGSVTAADLNQLALNWQSSVALWSAGDFTADGLVDAADLNQLALHWRQSTPVAEANAPVPEPTAFLLAVVGLTLLWQRRGRKET